MNSEQLSILHITNSYGGTTVYQNLFSELDKLGITQQIFVPLNSRNKYRVGNQTIDFKNKKSVIIYSISLKQYHKYLYSLKISTITHEIINKIDNLSAIDLIHASTLCLDGAVAYKLWEKYKIPYIVTVRNTDINSYYRKLIWHRSFFHKILIKAAKIIFISPSYQYRFTNEILPDFVKIKIQNKIQSIPNGVDRIFLENSTKPMKLEFPVKIVYAGGIQKNKNIHSSIEAIQMLRNEGFDINFTIIGKGLKHRRTSSKYSKKIEDFANSETWINILPSQSKENLKRLLSEYDIFIMPSFTETFGLAYVEALTQGLPIIYSKGQGFDGFFVDGHIGYSVNPNVVEDIALKLKLVIEKYDMISNNIKNLKFDQFNWEIIARKYQTFYTTIKK
jgi:glycosyltransferase involved in cell wall biosynthesis